MAPPAPTDPGCTDSPGCAHRFGYGDVCVAGRCEPYTDGRDIMDLFTRTPKVHAEPEPFVLYPSIIPSIGYNPALGFVLGLVSKARMLLGDASDTTMSSASLLVLLTTNKQLVRNRPGMAVLT